MKLNVTNYQRNEIKVTMRYHLTLVRRAIIKNCTNNKCWRIYGKKGTVGRNGNCCSHYGNQYEGSLKN